MVPTTSQFMALLAQFIVPMIFGDKPMIPVYSLKTLALF
jgi:hypothetical protein